ncbi:MAG: RNA 2',3'-cyclic phosphodiesterase, partial [Dictyoglomaceae bacterium]
MFIAVEFPDVVKDKILLFQNELKKVVSGNVKWVERENFHITLRFLGEIPEEMIEDIKKIMDEVVKYFSPFYISFDIFGA